MSKRSQNYRKYFWIIGINAVLLLIGWLFVQNPSVVDQYYSKGFYSYYSYLPAFLLDWLPFSFGDVFYVLAVSGIGFGIFLLIKNAFRKDWSATKRASLRLVCLLFLLHNFFYLSWGLNYYRLTLHEHYDLDVADVSKEDYFQVLDSLVDCTNKLRAQLSARPYWNQEDRQRVQTEMMQLMRRDSTFSKILSKKHIQIKQPFSSTAASYFTVTGYFNPFTHEVQVNALIPSVGYPFTCVHELAHQMGIGFEDECNFIAFQILQNHPNPAYQYSAHYEALQSFLQDLRYSDEALFDRYMKQLNPEIIKDLKEEYAFWSNYRGPVDYISGIIYNQYLQHNNQPEGILRYGMMNRLIIAWQKNKQL